MATYMNKGGKSGIKRYVISTDSIDIEFSQNNIYEYTVIKIERSKIDKMKAYAIEGQGLNSFINKHVRENFASRRTGTLPS